MTGPDPKYTEQELRLILQRAVEMERLGPSLDGVGGSLTFSELNEIAEEVGIDPRAIAAAAADLGMHGQLPGSAWLGPPATRTATRLLAFQLSEEDQRLLLRALEARLHRTGVTGEALGRVTWVSSSAQLTTEVALTVGEGTSRIDVEQSYPTRIRPLMHLLPGAFGFVAAVSLASPLGLFGAPLLAAAAAGGVVGMATGRGIWHLMAQESKRATRKLASELAASAGELAVPGSPGALPTPGTSSEHSP